ncbi:MAG: Fe(3+) ABC transporter substrate-binding protein [Oscillatoriales cyanobacterium RM2_1_1]|nr:Fe(3+) ABC transporter substrate-binding protein [Oscillatoriales cyanobacterium SM2_3_0]NJO45697.1 Fe(3+) ABC transporter substrate-binding protein [Oscillatoriales cyanobacterium RM2_1_1]
MGKITRRVFLAGSAALGAIMVGEMGQPGPSIANPKQINLYSARHYDTDNQIYQGFTNKTGIKVNLVEAKAEELVERIKSEGAKSPADVFLTVDAGNLWRAQQAGILQPVSSSVLAKAIPGNLRDPNNQWFGFSKRARVIVYDKSKVNPAQLSTYEDLANPKWKGKVLTRSSSNIYNQSLVAGMIETLGKPNTEKWAKGLVTNFARSPEGNDTAQIQAVAAGAAPLAIVNSYYLARLAASSKPEDKAVAQKVGMFFPNQRSRGTHINISGGGVVKTAPNKAGAIQFLEYLASPEAQKIFALGNNEYPVVAGVAIPASLSQYGTFKADPVNVAAYGKSNAEAIQLMDRAGWK